MPRERTGFVVSRKDKKTGELRWYARIQFVDPNTGQRRELIGKAKDEADAHKVLKNLKKGLAKTGESATTGDRMKFRELAGEYAKRRIIPARYHGGRKIAGLKNDRNPKQWLATLVSHFGGRLISGIRHADIEQYKLDRLAAPTRADVARYEQELETNPKAELRSTRTIASVNRELELMRAVMRYAYRQGWIVRSPFETGEPLISKADEVRRERVLSYDEERRLLEACGERTLTYKRKGKEVTAKDKGERRAYLRGLIVTALDTAMRRGEMLKLRWRDVDLAGRIITVTALNSKTARARNVVMTARVFEELSALRARASADADALVFGITDTVKKGFARACSEARIDGFRFHDFRHTAITRMVSAGIPPQEIMRLSGHTQMTTFLRYVNPTADSLRRAADLLSAFNAGAGAQDQSEGMVN